MNTLITHDTNCLDWKKRSKRLADLSVQSGSFDLLSENVVGFSCDADLLLCNISIIIRLKPIA